MVIICLLSGAPAFPGAQGYGAESAGGRGGVVLEVTSLEDAGYGTLRWAVEENTGPRTVVFRVSGIITLRSPIRVDAPYITIAGQTSPGGITIRGKDMDYALMEIRTHDVIIRYIRMRPGHRAPDCSAIRIDDFEDGDSIYNVILDHLSISWNTDEGVSIYGADNGISGITVQNSIFSEPLSVHPTTVLTGGNDSAQASRVVNVDFHHNLFLTTGYRNPLVKTPSFRFINNLVYNWHFYAAQVIGGVNADVVGNIFIRGPLDTVYMYHSITASSAHNTDAVGGEPSLYVRDNIGPYNPDPSNDNWVMVYEITGENGSQVGPAPDLWRRSGPLPGAVYPVEIASVDTLESMLLPASGASRRVDGWGRMVDARDSVDRRVISDFLSGRGFVPDSEEEVGGFISMPSLEPYPDGDHDGMSDIWEDAVGLDRSNPFDGNGHDFSPIYTNLEVFLNGLRPVFLMDPEKPVKGKCLFDVVGRKLSSGPGTGICIYSSGRGFRPFMKWNHR